MKKLDKMLTQVSRKADGYWNDGYELGRRGGYRDGVGDTRRDVAAELEKKLTPKVEISGRPKKRANVVKTAAALGYVEGITDAISALTSYTGATGETPVRNDGYVDVEFNVTEAEEMMVNTVIHEGELRARDKMLSVLKSRQHWYQDNRFCDCYECVELRTLESIIKDLIK